MDGRFSTVTARAAAIAWLAIGGVAVAGAPTESGHGGRPDILVITVDTLRSDRMSGFGYDRGTSPNLDRVMASGVKFTQARTVEPLTSPALCSMMTSRPPHRHGSTRNGLRMHTGLDSLPKELRYHGYRTAAFVGNWTLRDKLSGLAEHFDHYESVLTRRRWFGLVRSEATGEDLNETALAWLEQHDRGPDQRPVFVWLHYTEPHAPYRLWTDHARALGIDTAGKVAPSDRYDTEIAFVDDVIGQLLDRIEAEGVLHDPMIVFASDHGESLGEHNYWGHGRHLYEPTLRIPMAVTWPGHVAPSVVDAPALIVDLAPTLLALLEMAVPETFDGFDWSAVLQGGGSAPQDRVTHYQAHRGAVFSRHESDLARRSGLLAVGLIHGDLKEIFRVDNDTRKVFDLGEDPLETITRSGLKADASEALTEWLHEVNAGLNEVDDRSPEPLDPESIRQLRSLGYVD